jgi:hypothetical protein
VHLGELGLVAAERGARGGEGELEASRRPKRFWNGMPLASAAARISWSATTRPFSDATSANLTWSFVWRSARSAFGLSNSIIARFIWVIASAAGTPRAVRKPYVVAISSMPMPAWWASGATSANEPAI